MPKQNRNRNQNGGGNNKNKGSRKQRQNSTDYLSEPFTKKQLRREVKGAARAQYGDVTRQVKKEKRASNVQQKRINDYFPQYGKAVEEAAKRSATATSAATSQISADSKAAADYAETLRQRLAGEEAASASTRGVATDRSGSNVNASAQLARINAANVLTGVTASQGASAQNYYADKKAIGERERIEQKLRESARKRSYNEDLRDIAKDKGAFKVAKKAEIVDRERDFMVTKKAANFDRKSTKASLAETARHNQQSEATAAQNAATSRMNARTSARNSNTTRGNLRQRKKENRQDQRQRRVDNRQDRREAAAEGRNDPQDVQRAGVLIRQQISANPRWFATKNRAQIIDAIQAADQTLSRSEVAKAYNRNLSAIQQAAVTPKKKK